MQGYVRAHHNFIIATVAQPVFQDDLVLRLHTHSDSTNMPSKRKDPPTDDPTTKKARGASGGDDTPPPVRSSLPRRAGPRGAGTP